MYSVCIYAFSIIEKFGLERLERLLQWEGTALATSGCSEPHPTQLRCSHKKLRNHSITNKRKLVFKAKVGIDEVHCNGCTGKKCYHILSQLWEQIQHDAEASHNLQMPSRKGEQCLIHCLAESCGDLHTSASAGKTVLPQCSGQRKGEHRVLLFKEKFFNLWIHQWWLWILQL